MLLFNNTIVFLWWRTVIDAVKLVKEHRQIIRPEGTIIPYNFYSHIIQYI